MMLPVLLLFGLNSTFWLIWRQFNPTTVHSETGWITWRFLVLDQEEFGADIFCMFMTDGTYVFHLELLLSLIWVSANFQNYHDRGFFNVTRILESHKLCVISENDAFFFFIPCINTAKSITNLHEQKTPKCPRLPKGTQWSKAYIGSVVVRGCQNIHQGPRFAKAT